MTWSEFGRRVQENGSQGTDHGTAAPLFVLGNGVQGGVYGEPPDLDDLDPNGNLKFTTRLPLDLRDDAGPLARRALSVGAGTVVQRPEVPAGRLR